MTTQSNYAHALGKTVILYITLLFSRTAVKCQPAQDVTINRAVRAMNAMTNGSIIKYSFTFCRSAKSILQKNVHGYFRYILNKHTSTKWPENISTILIEIFDILEGMHAYNKVLNVDVPHHVAKVGPY